MHTLIRTFHSKCRGFTLVEILVVVAILVVLVALAFPAFGRARASAWNSKTVANLRLIAQADILYAAERGFHVPIINWSGNGAETSTRWDKDDAFLGYLGITAKDTGWVGRWPLAFQSPFAVAYQKSKGRSPLIQNSFGPNWSIRNPEGVLIYSWSPGSPASRNLVRPTDVTQPSTTIMFIEHGSGLFVRETNLKEWWVEGTEDVAFRFNRRANAAFFDGGVRALTAQELSGTTGRHYWRGGPRQ